jgi:protein gp37
MAENSKIEWTDHTFNPWIGCTKVSPGCTNCYAAVDTFARRERSHGRELWGPHAERHRTAEAYWKQPLKWNRQVWQQCVLCGWRGPVSETHVDCPICDGEEMEPTRQRVFCSSLADVFEDHPQLGDWRTELFALIEATPNLDWLLLTKRPENVSNMVPYGWMQNFPQNIGIGTSVENQKYADERIPALLRIPAKVRFLSCEPLLGKVDLHFNHLMVPDGYPDSGEEFNYIFEYIHWVICGGESGPHARPMHPDWARSLRDECQAAGVPFFFKQWGEWKPVSELYSDDGPNKAFEYIDHWLVQMEPNGAIPVMTPPVRAKEGGWHEYQPCPGSWFMAKVGKKEAGRLLDGREWNGMPS